MTTNELFNKSMHKTRYEMPIRIQFTLYNDLVAEVIVSGTLEAERVYHEYFALKYKRNLPMGGATYYSALSPRLWDVPVNSIIK